MKIAILSPLSWRTPPRRYGPRESTASLLSEQLVNRGLDVTLFATGDSITRGQLAWVCKRPWSEDSTLNPRVWECLHVAALFRRANEFDLIHNCFGFLPLSYSDFTQTPVVTTVHGLPSDSLLPIYKQYSKRTYYVAGSEAGKHPALDYIGTVYPGIDLNQFQYQSKPGNYLLLFGRICRDRGVKEAIRVAIASRTQLVIAGSIEDEAWYRDEVEPLVDGTAVRYVGAVDNEQRQTLVGGARALLHLAQSQEGLGLSVAESLACGTPVVAFRRGAMPELIHDGMTGFVVTSTDEAVQAIGHLGSIDRRHCRDEAANRFSAERMTSDYLEIYTMVLDRRENYRPWGHYEDLVERGDHKIKEILVKPGERLSLQKHLHRAEHWVIVSGEAVVTVGSKETRLKPGQSVDVPKGSVHRISNPGKIPLLLVEIQMGDYFGEDDIIRLEDDYGREPASRKTLHRH